MITIDVAAKFHNYLHLEGWYVSNKRISSIKIIGTDIGKQNQRIYLEAPSINVANAFGWTISVMFNNDFDPLELNLMVYYWFGMPRKIKLKDLIQARLEVETSTPIAQFDKLVNDFSGCNMLDIGGRDRSLIDRSVRYPNANVTVLDILAGQNVDVVGDAHCLSNYFGRESFDFAMSYCVFEHLHSPWKVAIEMNKVLKINGYALIVTHQTLGLHDMPWDFFRFSDNSFKGIFNEFTGFEIVSTSMVLPSFIIPFIYRTDKKGAEKSAGYELSTVLIRKKSNSIAEWNYNLTDSLEQGYPKTESSFDPSNMELPY